jgi:hypothetical protein
VGDRRSSVSLDFARVFFVSAQAVPHGKEGITEKIVRVTLRWISTVLGASAVLASVALLFNKAAHDYLSAFALAGIAVAWFLWKIARGGSAGDLLRAALLAAPFLFWAANQFWPNSLKAALFNDLAVGLFVVDVFLSIQAERRTKF